MSHLTKVELTVKDLDALKEAATALGLEVVEGQETFKWFGRAVGDTTEGARIAAEQGSRLGKSAHAIRLKDAERDEYEIGVVPIVGRPGTYELLFDTWGPGYRIAQKVGGVGGPKLKVEYAVATATKRAKRTLDGWAVERQDLPNGRVHLRVRQR